VGCHDRNVTQVLERPRAAARRKPDHAAAPAPLWLRSLLAAVWSVAVALAVLVVVALIVWTADSRSTASASTALRFVVALWLAAQRVPLAVPGGTIAVAPLGLTILIGLLLARFAAVVARGAQRQEPGAVAALVLATSLPYAGLSAALAYAARTPTIRPSVGIAFVATGIFAVVTTTAGGLYGSGLSREVWDRLPAATRGALRAAGAAALVLVATATVLTIGAVVHDAKLIGASLHGYGNGSGRFTMAVLSLLLGPNAVVMTTSYLSGAGFAVGAGSSVTMGASHVGATPALPILATVPRAAASWPTVALAMTVVAGAAVVAAWRVRRDAGPVPVDQLRAVAGMAVVIGLGGALLAALAGGPIGPGRLATFGASPWRLGLTLASEIAGPALVFVAVQAWWRLWRSLPGR
jgi:hypothetical protein